MGHFEKIVQKILSWRQDTSINFSKAVSVKYRLEENDA
jgi:hypothetical protein